MDGEREYTYLNWHELEAQVDEWILASDIATHALLRAIADKAKDEVVE